MTLFASRSVWTEPGTFALRHSPLPTSRNVQPESSETRVRAFVRALVWACAQTEANDAARREANTIRRRTRACLPEESLDRKPSQALKIFVKARDKVSCEVIKIPGTS